MIKIGWSTKNVSTDKAISLPGQFYKRISKGVLDPVTVNVLVIEGDDDIAIFMSGDLVVSRCGLLDEIRENVRALNNRIPVEKILFNATHTHCGPSHYYGSPESDEYRHFFAHKAAEAVSEAYESRAEGAIAYGYGYAVVSHSRRVVYFDDLTKREDADPFNALYVDGHARMYGDTNDTMFSGYEAGADHFINIFYTFDKNKKLTGAIINVPCPSQNSEKELYITADYWHDVKTALREKYGDIHIVSQCAAAGDLSPRIMHYFKAQERRYRLKYSDVSLDERVSYKTEMYSRFDIAERICQAFDEVLSWAKKDILWDAPIKHRVKTIELSKRLVSDEDYEFCRTQYEKICAEKPDENADEHTRSYRESEKERYFKILKRYEEQKQSETLPMELHVIKIGEVAFASNRFELYMDYQHRIQARSPFVQTFVVQLCAQPGDDGGTYLATERGVENVGYSATLFCNLVSPKGGQQLVESTLDELNKLYEE